MRGRRGGSRVGEVHEWERRMSTRSAESTGRSREGGGEETEHSGGRSEPAPRTLAARSSEVC